MKIVILDGYTLNPGDLSWDSFRELGELIVYDRTPGEDVISRIGDASIVITNKTPITEETLIACPHIRYIGVLATGYNVVDIAAAKARHIAVTNIPAYGTQSVAQFAIAMLLEICHHIADHSRAVYEGRWTASQDFCFWDYPMIELAGKTMGIIGFGRIGRAVGRIAAAMGMKVIAYSRSQCDEGRSIGEYVSLDTLLAQSDVISLHCPLFAETEGLIRKDTIAKMKDGVILLNNSRGPLIVEQDVAYALNVGKIAYAAVDVVDSEPIQPKNPLLKAKNCLITPHISWAAFESRERLMDIAANNLKAFLNGTPVNIVNS